MTESKAAEAFKNVLKNAKGENLDWFAGRLAFSMLADFHMVPEIGWYHSAIIESQDARTAMNAVEALFAHICDGTDLSLFEGDLTVPEVSDAALPSLKALAMLDLKDASPAILGTAVEAALESSQRRRLGIHYTPEGDILKVVKPLFVDGFKIALGKIRKSGCKIEAQDALNAIRNASFLDPACGCGSFLACAYSEMRKLERECLDLLGKEPISSLKLGNFKGIELMPVPTMAAEAVLVLAQRRMDILLGMGSFQSSPCIKCGNALTEQWPDVDFIFGNPPFGGVQTTDASQKAWIRQAFNRNNTGVLDYAAAWYEIASQRIEANHSVKAAFLSTSSVCQGEQVAGLWKGILARGQEILFAVRPFDWLAGAGVNCCIVGFGKAADEPRRLFGMDGSVARCQSISPYLRAEPTCIAEPRTKALSAPLEMVYGNKLLDGGWLELDNEEVVDLLAQYPELKPYVLKLGGGKELLSGNWKHCFWLKDAPQEILANPEVRFSVDRCKQWRLSRNNAEGQRLAKTPHLYKYTNRFSSALLVPRVNNADRAYIPMAFIEADTIANDQVQMVPNASLYVFGIATSKMHLAWVGAVCGRLANGIRYSRDVCWNTFPWPNASDEAMKEVAKSAKGVLEAREAVPMPLGEMYKTSKFPQELKDAHKRLDEAVDRLYGSDVGFDSDGDRLQVLFPMYNRLMLEASGKSCEKPIDLFF